MDTLEIKGLVEEKLTTGTFTVQQLCGELGLSDDFDVITAIAMLEYEGKTKSEGYHQVFREDGGAILLSKYTHI